MDEAELVEFLAALEEALSAMGLTSLVEQERRAASEGTAVELTRADIPKVRRGQPRAEVGDVRFVPLSTSHRIAMLLDLVEVAVGGTFAISEQLLGFVESEFPELGAMRFSSDVAEGLIPEDDRSWTLPERSALEARRADVQAVVQVVFALREATGVARAVELAPATESRAQTSNRVGGWA